MKEAKIIYVIISIICVISIIIGVYEQFFNKKDDNTNISTNGKVEEPIEQIKEKTMEEIKDEFNAIFINSFSSEGKDISDIERINKEKNIVYAAYNIQQENDFFNIDLNIPVINIKGDIPKEFNKITQEVFVKKANEVMENTNVSEKIIYSIDYAAYINGDILSVIIKSSLKQGNNPQRIIVQTYNYNIKTKEKVTLSNIIEQKNIDEQKLKSKIDRALQIVKREEEILTQSGYSVYVRDLNSDVYKLENITNFFLDNDEKLYIIFAYGNQNFTSELDIVKYE
ncbi:unknown [Clostridium sp. CAG:798]|jgi:hypothetical protein|nr:unknown [Clostridium sp. CAG:798]HBJ12737.1 hypothetical protein [Clostridiales bacterium]